MGEVVAVGVGGGCTERESPSSKYRTYTRGVFSSKYTERCTEREKIRVQNGRVL